LSVTKPRDLIIDSTTHMNNEQVCKEGLDSSEGPARMQGMRTLAELHRYKRLRSGQQQLQQGQSSSITAGDGISPALGEGLDPDSCVGQIKPALASLLARRFSEVRADTLLTHHDSCIRYRHFSLFTIVTCSTAHCVGQGV